MTYLNKSESYSSSRVPQLGALSVPVNQVFFNTYNWENWLLFTKKHKENLCKYFFAQLKHRQETLIRVIDCLSPLTTTYVNKPIFCFPTFSLTLVQAQKYLKKLSFKYKSNFFTVVETTVLQSP